ncbi:MAG: radical SAM protein, partial [Oscillospiraceae bacterium]|nr:radical SAM protein [Oscillospiraceae bacterium]
ARAGARFVYPAFGVTMRQGQREYFLDGLERAFPGQGLKERYLRRFGDRYWCASPRAGKLWQAFTAACQGSGILYDMKSIIRAASLGYGDRQLTFFD